MTKIAVYDSKNKERLLGHLDVGANHLQGMRYEVPLFSDVRRVGPPAALSWPEIKTLVFDIDFRCTTTRRKIDAFTTEVVTFERKVLLTGVTLDTLMELKTFTLPAETERQASERRYVAANLDY